MSHVKLYEKFVAEEEDSNIYGTGEMTSDSAAPPESPKELELKKAIVKTWVNDYVIPMIDFKQDWNSAEKDPKFKAFVAKAKAWLRKPSGIPERSFIDDKIVGVFPNSVIVNINLYNAKDAATHPSHKKSSPIMASFYEDFVRK
jgi:hypothetical protein